MKYAKIHPFALQEIFDLLEDGYRVIDSHDNDDCFTVFIMNDDDNTKFFDFDYIEEEDE